MLLLQSLRMRHKPKRVVLKKKPPCAAFFIEKLSITAFNAGEPVCRYGAVLLFRAVNSEPQDFRGDPKVPLKLECVFNF